MTPSKLDWPGLMYVGLHQLGLSAAEFWDLTPNELSIKLGVNGAMSSVMTRSGFSTLSARFPDKKKV